MKKRKYEERIRGILSSNRGISLVEVVVSLALLAIVVVLIANLLMTGYYMIYTTSPKSQKAAKLAGNVAGAGNSSGSSTSSDGTVISAESGSVTITFHGTASSPSTVSSTLSGTYQNGAAGDSSSGNSGSSGADVNFWTFDVQ